MVAHQTTPYQRFQDVVEAAKRAPDSISFASSGVGGLAHVSTTLLQQQGGFRLVHVPYRGGGPAVQDVVAGHVKMMFADVGGSAHELIRDGRLRALAVTTSRRVDTMPDIPTMHEAGITDYEANAWIAIVAPARTPAAIVGKLNGAFNDILSADDTKAHFSRLGWQPLNTTPQQLGDHIKSEIVRWGKVMQAAGAEGVE